MSLLGIHISNIYDIPELHKKHNINYFQFTVSPTINYTNEHPIIINYIKNNNIYCSIHSSYSINLGSPWKVSDWKIQQLINEIIICDQLGAFCIIVHTGKSLNYTITEAINNMYTALLYIHQQTIKYSNIKILIETPSGQGTEILTNVDDFCNFINKFITHPDKTLAERINICIDTCHIFAAGYDISNKLILNKYFGHIDDIIGINKIKLIHINDSKDICLSKKDRHANIGKGKIGKHNIINLIKCINKLEIPMMLETPSKEIINDYELIMKVL